MVDYEVLARQLEALVEGVPYEIANLSNASALLWEALPDINWVGFYKMIDGALVLYPFQGKPACIRITLDRGVWRKGRRSALRMSKHSRGTSPATAPPIPRSWCPCTGMEKSGACWTSTAPLLDASPKPIRPAWSASPG